MGGVIAADAVAELLERSGLTKSELSARSGVSRSLIDDYLKARRQPSVAQLARLGAAAGFRFDIVWETPSTPHWARPHPDMEAPPLTVPERAHVLELVVAAATELQRRPAPDEMAFPPFRTLIVAEAPA